MSKAILVIDMPDDLFEYYENFYVDYDLRAERKNAMIVESIKYVEECPIKPLPNKNDSKIPYISNRIKMTDGEEVAYYMGYNACIDEILGEE